MLDKESKSSRGQADGNARTSADLDAAAAADVGAAAKTKRRKALGAALAVLAVLAVIVLVLVCLYARGAGVGSSELAAKVDEQYITEQEVADYITAYRYRMQVTDDAKYAALLVESGLDVAGFREQAIGQIAVDKAVDAKAKELGVAPSDEEVEQQMDTMKEALAFGDDKIWADTIQMYGMKDEQIRARTYTRLAQKALYEKVVPVPVPTNAQIKEYIAESKLGTAMKHSYRIVFSGESADERARKCWKQIQKARDKLDTAMFSALALTNSDDEDAQSSAGAYGWSDAEDMESDYLAALEKLDAGECSDPVSIGEDGEVDIIYCDTAFEFPKKQAAAKGMDLDSLPDSLTEYLSDCAAQELWNRDCETNLSGLMADVQIEFYPMPDNAPYDVDLSLAETAGAEPVWAADTTKESRP